MVNINNFEGLKSVLKFHMLIFVSCEESVRIRLICEELSPFFLKCEELVLNFNKCEEQLQFLAHVKNWSQFSQM